MSEIRIEKNIPVPTLGGKWPFREMTVGDSFLMAGKAMHQASGIISTYTRRTGFKFTSRAEQGGVRVWRIA